MVKSDRASTPANTNKLFFGDNLNVLRERIQDESVDLIYLDPPFNSNANYNAFFAEKDHSGQVIDYHAAVTGSLRLIPEGAAYRALEEDYMRMVDEGLLFDDAEPFARLMEIVTAVQDLANLKPA